ncbi:MAG: gluconate kinase [Leptolyngbyaceae cyanobacterium SL_5_14]|nr:gluconate kinase [Leptolyngbyaceae cyanobacterium SL_5_14]
MNSTYFIGVDVGTTSTKAIVFSASGASKGAGNQGYPLLTPHPSWAEQEPEAIFTAVIAAVRDAVNHARIAASEVTAVGFSAATHSLIAVDPKGYPLTHSIIWADNRSTPQVERLKGSGKGYELYQRTGAPTHPTSLVTKLLWMQEHDPETFSKAAKFVSLKEYVLHQLFDEYVVDYSIASATGLFNPEQLDWDEEALAIAGLKRSQLSQLVPTTHILRGLKPRYAEAMGLAIDTPVVVGANDGALANLGVGAITPEQIAITIGTSAAVRTVAHEPLIDPKERTFCYALTKNHWVIGGPSNNGGIVLRWLRDQFCQAEIVQARQLGVDPYDLMIQSAATVSAGAEGLIFLPFLSGERAPYWNANARGSFFGLGLHHQRSHLIRAVLEGVLFSVYSIYLALQNLTGSAQVIRASGGFARSKVWRQMMADLFQAEVLVPEVYEGSSFGAAVLAMYAVNLIKNLEEVQQLIRITYRHQPNTVHASTYHELFEIYERLYQNTVEEAARLAAYQVK